MLTIYVYDPRLFLRVLEVLRRRGVSFRVPKNPVPECPGEGVVVTDMPELYSDCSRPVVSLRNDWEKKLEEALCMARGGDKYSVLIIGVDPGDPPTYVIIADDMLLEGGEAEPEELVLKIEEALMRIPYGTAVLRIGDSGTQLGNILEALAGRRLEGIRIELVDEHGTSRTNPRFSNVRNRDVSAAINIAYKKGIRLETTVAGVAEQKNKAW